MGEGITVSTFKPFGGGHEQTLYLRKMLHFLISLANYSYNLYSRSFLGHLIHKYILCFAAHLEHLIMCKKEKEQTTTPISLGVVCCRVYLSTIFLQN